MHMTFPPLRLFIVLFLSLCFSISGLRAQTSPVVTGELKKWHKITLTFDGPICSETGSPNPFLDYRLSVTFSNGTTVYEVPGFFAADGNAANTGATSGNKWRVHFAPDAVGVWTWTANFKSGSQIAIDLNPDNGTATSFDGSTGTLTVGATDKTGRDFRGKGRLNYVGEHYLQFAETGEYFIKTGADAPENMLAYDDIDNTTNIGGYRKSWSPHVGDWQTGDPTWKNGLGKGLIGAINYLSSKGMNAFSFLTMNINGDDKNVFPYVVNNGNAAPQNDRRQFDCSKLDQWDVVFEHADHKGMHLHFKTQEIENDNLLDGGNLGVERKLYYRELVARFGYHLALNWNLGEEYDAYLTLNDPQLLVLKACAQYFKDMDPYDHNIVVHTYPNQWNAVYTPMLGTASQLTGTSLQVNYNQVHQLTLDWVKKSNVAGKPWVVANDEQGSANDGLRPDGASSNLDNIRRYVLWGNLMAGGAGVEYYFGYAYPNSDLTCQDWRSRDQAWTQTNYAQQFFTNNVPFWEMSSHNELVNNVLNANTNYCFAKPGDTYVVYRPSSSPFLDLQSFADTFDITWLNPRTGGALATGTIGFVVGPGNVTIGNPPNTTTSDWVALVKGRKNVPLVYKPIVDITQPLNGSTIAPATNATITATASDPDGTVASVQFTANNVALQTITTAPYTYTWTPPGAGVYVLRAIATDNQGLKGRDSVTVTVLANQSPAIQFTQPATNSQFNYNQTIPLSVTATDADGTISQVRILQGSNILQIFFSPPYSINWTPPGPGTYIFTAQATDNLGAVSTTSITATVLANQPPQLQITQPTAGTQYAYNQTIPFQATASDVDGSVSQVDFYVNNVPVQTFTSAPYSFTVVPSGAGIYTLKAVATDDQGLTTTVTNVVTVLPNQPPVININQPTVGASYNYTQLVNIDASVSDADGTIDSVWFSINGVQVAAFASGPYTYVWTPTVSGQDTLMVMARDNTGQTSTASRVFTVLPNLPPIVQITAPASASLSTINVPVQIEATASDPEGSPVYVSFYAAGVLLNIDSIAPFQATWTPTSLGNKTIIAIGEDSLGLTGADTITIQIVANQPPVVQFTAPANNSQSITGQPLTLNVTATDPDGTVTKVDFFAGGALIGTDNTAPFSLIWTPVVAGNYSVVATATDDQGETNSAILSISVVSNLSPLVQVTQPTNLTTFSQSQSVSIAATASDPDGTVTQVQFYVGNTLVQTDVTSPYTATWSPSGTGTFFVKAIATDNMGALGKDSVQITVVPNQKPVVSITQPANNSSKPLNVAVPFSATASDPDGTVSKVEFFVNGSLIGTQFLPGYNASWTPTSPGFFTLVAKATDNQGATGADTIYVTVTNQKPVVSITSPANNSSKTVGLPFTITATASDPDGTVASVSFYHNGVLITTDATSPYSAIWSPTATGNVILKAVATDNFGTTGADSITLVIAPNQAPIVTITQPANNSSQSINQPVTITATATDPDGTVTKVEFFNGTTLLFTDTQAPYSYSWSPPAAGIYTLTAKATDNANQVGSASVTITVVPNQSPLVQITSPTGLTSFFAGIPINIQATASDQDGTVNSVTFLINGSTVLVDQTAPYSYSFTPASQGSYTVIARAIDNSNTQGADTVVIQVLPNFAPVVTFTQPSTNTSILTGTNLNIQFSVTDQDNNITSISLTRNGSQVQTYSGTGSFSYNWTPTAAGIYTFIATAIDAGGNTRTATVVVTVTAPNYPPVVSILSPSNGSNVYFLNNTQIQVSATDPGGSVAQVQFYLGNSLQQTLTAAPFNFSWYPQGNGPYTVIAKATDNLGLVSYDTVNVNSINNPAGPQVTIVSPTAGQSVPINIPLTIKSNVSISSGSITQVQFISAVGNIVLATITAPPYQFNWTPTTVGGATIRCRATGSNGIIGQDQVSFNVTNATQPVVEILSPSNGANVYFLNNTLIQVSAADPNGTISQVQFYLGTSLQQTLTSAPYTFNWTPQGTGAYTIIAKATDNSGIVVRDTALVNCINNPAGPQVSFVTPTLGQNIPVNQPFLVKANVTISTGSISQVKFYSAVGNVLLQTLTAPPYEFLWTPTTPGAATLRCRATGSNGIIGQEQIGVNVSSYLPPTVQFIYPVNNGNLALGQSNQVQISASDPDGSIAEVQFLVGNTLIGSVFTAPYNFNWTSGTQGPINLIARARDSQGLWSADTIQVNVAANQPPSVSFTSPLQGGNVYFLNTTPVTVSASDPDGTVAQVQFFVGSSLIQTKTSAPFTFTFTPQGTGSLTLSAKATDNLGLVSTATIQVSSINNPAGPQISFVSPTPGQNLALGVQTLVKANVTIPSGSISQVQFIMAAGNVVLQTLTAPPYEFSWTPTAAGAVNLRCRAVGSNGMIAQDQVIFNVINDSPPLVNILSPTNGSNVFFLTQTPVQVIASDSGGSVSSVQYYLNNILQQTITVPPYNFNWMPQGTGAYTLVAKATDNLGLISSDTVVVNSINNPAGPSVSFVNPIAGQAVPFNVPVTVKANVSIPAGTISQVQFISAVGNTVLATLTAPPYQFNWTPTTVGPVTLRCRATGSNGLVGQDQVSFNVVNASFPVVQILSPSNGSNVYFLNNTPIQVSAIDPDGSITQVQFFLGNGLQQTLTSAPYTFNWTPQGTGPYTIIIRATDNVGLVSSDTVLVNCVSNPAGPQISFVAPVNGQSIPVNQPFLIKANVSIPTGTVTQVQFFSATGNVLLQTLTAPPYQFLWTPSTPGPATIRCRANGSNGIIAQEQVSVTVSSYLPPAVSFIQPTVNAQLAQNQNNSIQIAANDPDGSIVEVQFLVGNTLVGTSSTPPFNFNWYSSVQGSFNFIARARDSQGIWSSDTIQVTVAANQPPSVSFATPVSGGAVYFLNNTPVTVSASDPDGTIAQVQFFVGSALIQTKTVAPYTFTFTPQGTGPLTLTAKAFDNQGLTSSQVIQVNALNNPAGPQISFVSPIQGQTIAIGTPTLVKANVTIPSGSITQVQFIAAAGNVLLQTLTAPPYQFTWTPTTLGPFNIRCRAIGSNGMVAQEQVIITISSSFTGGQFESLISGQTVGEKLIIYPNPTERLASLVLPDYLLTGGPAELTWFAMDGKVVRVEKFDLPLGEPEIPLDTDGLPAGNYLLRLDFGGGRSVGRLIKQD